MVQLRVVVAGTTPAETLQVEDTLQQTGCLASFRYINLAAIPERAPKWEETDLLLARYQETTGPDMLVQLAPLLRAGSPRILFLVDPYDPLLVTGLFNAGAAHVLPLASLDTLLEASLNAIIGAQMPRSGPALPISPVDGADAAAPDQDSPESAVARLFRSSPLGMAIQRLRDGLCLEINDSLAAWLDCSREDLLGRVLPELALPADIRADLQSSGPATSTRQFERKILSRSRQVRHIQVQVDRIHWAGEDCALALVQDVTERQQDRETIRRLNDEFEKMLQIRTNALQTANRELEQEIGQRKNLQSFSDQLNQVIWETPDVVAIYDPDGRMQFLNRAGRALFGISTGGSVSHLTLQALFGADFLPRVKKDGLWRGEIEIVLPDGRKIPLSQVALMRKDETGAILYYATFSRDISDFKLVEKMLRVSRERYRTLAEAAHDLIFMVSRDGLMEYANGYACQALGIVPDQVEGMPVARFFPQDFAVGPLGMLKEVHEIEQPVYTEGPFTRGGSQFWLGTWLVPIHDDQHNLASILGISRDITEQKKTDEALQRALQNERRLGEMRSNFFSMTSHQFRTPLSTILLSTELLLKYGQRWDDHKRGEHLERIQEAAGRLNGMLEDILVIGRVESGRYVCTPKDFDLAAFCATQLEEIRLNDRGRHTIDFRCDPPDGLQVYQDPEVLHRVVDNLLSNALKYSPEGTQVSWTIRLEDQHILLEVADQGIGIPERDQPYLFQPFQRGSNASEIPGTGIGLTIIQKSVELMNGQVSLKSKEGQGTVFMVRFPCRLSKATEHHAFEN